MIDRCEMADSCKLDALCPFYLDCVQIEMDKFYGDDYGDTD